MPTLMQTMRALVADNLVMGKSAAKLAKEEARSVVQFRRAARDALYLILDMWTALKRAHKEYGDFHKYLNQAAKGKVNPEDFRNSDLGLLKRMIENYRQIRGPLTSFDIRWFYYMYAFFFMQIAWMLYQFWILSCKRDEVRGSMDMRRQLFDKDYIED
jgi:hypothetical protein